MAAARRLWREHVKENQGTWPDAAGKYEVCRQIESTPAKATPLLPSLAA